MKKFLNISNHTFTNDQLVELAQRHWEPVELPADLKSRWSQCDPSTYEQLCYDIEEFMRYQQIHLAHLAGFAPAVVFMCKEFGNIDFYYAYSVRESVEVTLNGNEVRKQNIFKHKGFYPYYNVK